MPERRLHGAHVLCFNSFQSRINLNIISQNKCSCYLNSMTGFISMARVKLFMYEQIHSMSKIARSMQV